MTTKRLQQLVTIGLLVLIGLAACRAKPKTDLIPLDYHAWQETTEILLNYPIPGHESHFREIYINDIGRNIRMTKKNQRVFYDFPEGAIIVKEVFDGLEPPATDESPMVLTVMIKQPEHPQSRGGWLWVVKNIKTQEERIIDYELCVDCHANANEQHPYGDKNSQGDFRDYVFLPPMPATVPALPDTSSQTGADYN